MMQLSKISSVVALLFVLLISSCSQPEEISYFEQIKKSDEGDFRGVLIGSTINQVLKSEGIEPDAKEGDYLYYDIPLNDKDSYSVSYSFDRDGLYEIQIDVYCISDPGKVMSLFKEISSEFKQKYGRPSQEDKRLIGWVVKNRTSELDISIIDDSDSAELGKLSITFYDFN